MNNRFLILLIIMFLALLWWTRYQHLGLRGSKYPILMNRLTGKVYIITNDKWHEIGIDKKRR